MAGLVTGETPYRPKQAVPLLPVYVPVVPDPELARQAIRDAMLQERQVRPVRTRQPLPPQMQVSNHRVQYQAPVAPTPLAHPQSTSPQQRPQMERPKSRGSAFGGCLFALLILGSVFFNVIRDVVEALLDAIR